MLHPADTHKNGFVPGGNKGDAKTTCDTRPDELLPLNSVSGGKGDDKHDGGGDVRVTIRENPLEEAAGAWDNSSPQQQQELEPLQQQQQQPPQTQVQQQQQQQVQQQDHVSWRGGRRSRAESRLLGLVVLLVLAVLGLLLLLLLRPPLSGG